MSDLRLVVCPTDRQTIAERVGLLSVRCRLCYTLICTCARCGCMTLASEGIALRCTLCWFERMVLPSDLDGAVSTVRAAPAPQVQKAAQRRPADPFIGMPMPRQRGKR